MGQKGVTMGNKVTEATQRRSRKNGSKRGYKVKQGNKSDTNFRSCGAEKIDPKSPTGVLLHLGLLTRVRNPQQAFYRI